MRKEIIKIQDDIEESDEELIEIISPKKDENTNNWYDTNNFEIILTTIDRNNFNHKNKIGILKFNGINNLINKIKNNTISEALAKQKLDALNEIKKAEIQNKRLISSQKKQLNLFDELVEASFNNNKSMNEDDNVSVNENENDNDNDDDSDSDNVDDDDNDNNHNEQYYKIRQLNNYFEAIDKTKSFEEQIEILKARDFLDEYWHDEYYHDNKELNLRIFKAKTAHLDVDEDLFKTIFGQTFAALADKLRNTTSKEENQIIINDIITNKDKIFEQDDQSNFVIYPGYKRGDLLDAVKIIIDFNEVLSLDLT